MNADAQVIQIAYADLVAHVFLCIRNGEIVDRQQLHDLGDALHNVSGMLGRYGRWIDDHQYRTLYLKHYDAIWGHKGLALEAFLDDRMQSYSTR